MEKSSCEVFIIRKKRGEVRIGSIEGDAESSGAWKKIGGTVIGKACTVSAGESLPYRLGSWRCRAFTLRGRELLEQADAVVYDALAGDAVLGWIPEHTRKIDVGKRVDAIRRSRKKS